MPEVKNINLRKNQWQGQMKKKQAGQSIGRDNQTEIDVSSPEESERKQQFDQTQNQDRRAKNDNDKTDKQEQEQDRMRDRIKALYHGNLVGALFAGKGKGVKILVIILAYILLCFSYPFLLTQCWKDEKALTAAVPLLLLLIIVIILGILAIIILRGSCDSAAVQIGIAFGKIPDYCKDMGIGAVEETGLQQKVGFDEIK